MKVSFTEGKWQSQDSNISLPIPVQCLFYLVTNTGCDDHRILLAVLEDVNFDDFELLIAKYIKYVEGLEITSLYLPKRLSFLHLLFWYKNHFDRGQVN